MKPWKKYTLGALATVLLAVSVWVVNLIWFKPFDIDLFYDRSFVRFVITNPEFLSSMRVVPPALEWYEDDFSDDSVAKQVADAAQLRETLATLRSYDRADQTAAQLLSTDILDWFLDQSQRGGFASMPGLLLSRPPATLSSIRNGGEGRGEEAL